MQYIEFYKFMEKAKNSKELKDYGSSPFLVGGSKTGLLTKNSNYATMNAVYRIL